MSLAAKIRRFDPKKNSSVDVAAKLDCRDEYVRAVWQRLSPEKRQEDYAKHREWVKKNRDRYKAYKRAYYHRKKLEAAETKQGRF